MIKHLSLIFLASLTLGHVIFPRDPIPQDQELSASDSATPPQPTDAKAIVPTESGQIGINPVTVPNIPLSEITPAGPDTALPPLPTDANAASTTATTTVTVNGVPTVLAFIPALLSFAFAADGSVTVEFSTTLLEQLETVASKVVPCGGEKMKRSLTQTQTCGFGNYLEQIQQDQGLYITVVAVDVGPVEAAAEAAVAAEPDIAAAVESSMGGIDFENWGLIYFTWAAIAVDIGSAASTGGKIPPVLTFKPPGNGGVNPDTDGPNNDGCSLPQGQMYVCEDDDCQGVASVNNDEKCQADGSKKGCSCGLTGSTISDHWNQDIANAVQRVLGQTDPPECDQNREGIETTFIQGLITAFCADGLGSDKNSNLSYTDSKTPGQWDGYKDWTFTFGWQPFGSACQSSDCETLFSQSLSTCAYDSHTVAVTSTYATSCAVGTWLFVNPSPAPVPPASPPHAMGGICSLHLNQTRTCAGGGKDLFGTIVVRDNINSIIYEQETTQAIDASDPWTIDLPLFTNTLVIVAEQTDVDDYVQFSMGNSMWKSSDTDSSQQSNGWCSLGGWDPNAKNGLPNCNSLFTKNPTSMRQMDCSWRC